MEAGRKQLEDFRQRVFKMVSVGVVDDPINQSYDVISTAMLLINLIGAFAGTFDSVALKHGELLSRVEAITVAFFALDYILRVFGSISHPFPASSTCCRSCPIICRCSSRPGRLPSA